MTQSEADAMFDKQFGKMPDACEFLKGMSPEKRTVFREGFREGWEARSGISRCFICGQPFNKHKRNGDCK
jgi:hypothetical protein